jgi:hypothetical protein
MLLIGAFGQINGPRIVSIGFNPQRTTYQYVQPQSIGGGLQSRGGYVKMHETYHEPRSVGGGLQSRGGFARVRDEPYVGPIAQKIINIAEFMTHH